MEPRLAPEDVTPLEADGSLDHLAATLATKRLVALGESSHGPADFYRLRRELSIRLIRDHGFSGVVAEADWPDALAITRFVRGQVQGSADDALSRFQRFPTWMWRNKEIRALAGWLRSFNRGDGKAGFYGMDLYSLHASMREVIAYLERTNPEAAVRAKERYGCFDRFGEDAQSYGRATADSEDSCEEAAVEQLLALQRRRAASLTQEGSSTEGTSGAISGALAEEAFYAEQNARLVKSAEAYYRAMYQGRVSSWNLRDTHMADTVDALLDHLARHDRSPRLILWAHNSHLGDARATDMGRQGELNVGQLLRQRHPDDTALVGFTTYRGTVTAAHDWDDFAQRMNVRPGLPGSVEELLHGVGLPSFWLATGHPALDAERLERFIGVIYRPVTERRSHYFRARLSGQFDVVVHVDESQALEPLAAEPLWQGQEAPETYPSGL